MGKSDKQHVTEQALLKALGELEGTAADDLEKAEASASPSDEESSEETSGESSEESTKKPPPKAAKKSHTAEEPGLPDDESEANGGFGEEPDAEGEGVASLKIRSEGNVAAKKSLKTMKSLVQESDALRKGFEVSEFMESLVDTTATSVDGLMKSVVRAQNEQRAFNAKVQNALIALGNAVVGVQKSLADAEEEPMQVRPRSVVSKSQIVQPFGGEERSTSFSKAETLEALISLAEAKQVPPIAVSRYEADGSIEPSYIPAVSAKLKSLYSR